MVQKTPKQQNTQRKFRRNSLKKNIKLTAFHLWLRKLFEDFYRFVSRKKKNILPIGIERNSWSFESRPGQVLWIY